MKQSHISRPQYAEVSPMSKHCIQNTADESTNTISDIILYNLAGLNICVYDPMTGRRAFLPDPPEMAKYSPGCEDFYSYVLLTASDGIGRCFLLLAADFTMLMYPKSSIDVLTVSSPDAAAAAAGGGEWSPVTSVKSHRRSHCSSLHPYSGAVVIGGTVHWIMHGGGRDPFHVLTYDVGAATAGWIELPVSRLPSSYRERYDANLRLAASPEGMLTVLVRDKLTVTVWRLQAAAGGGWARHAVIDTEPTLRSLLPGLSPSTWEHGDILLKSAGERSGVVLFHLEEEGRKEEGFFIALDVETKEMHRVNSHDANIQALLIEIDLESRLSAMKIF